MHQPSDLNHFHSSTHLGTFPHLATIFKCKKYSCSFKMKISIILGVLHMLFGVCLSFWNHRYFQKPMNVYTEFIPQILFLCCMFGYLSLLMFIKWSKYMLSFKFCVMTSYLCKKQICSLGCNLIFIHRHQNAWNSAFSMWVSKKGGSLLFLIGKNVVNNFINYILLLN